MESCPAPENATTSQKTSSMSKSTTAQNLCAQQAAKHLGVCGKTLRRWHQLGYITATRTPGNQRIYDINSIRSSQDQKAASMETNVAGRQPHVENNFIYARVSSTKQQGDLERQIQTLTQEYSGFRVISDIGSGINFKRPGLQKLIKCCLDGNVGSVVVAHRDRLCRIAFDFFEFLFRTLGVKLVVHSKNHGETPEQSELGEDLMAIVHVFSARHYGKRRYGKTKDQKCEEGQNGSGTTGNADGPPRKRGRPRKSLGVGSDTGSSGTNHDEKKTG